MGDLETGDRQALAEAAALGTGQLRPTPRRLRVAAAIARGEVFSYAWSGQSWHGVTQEPVTWQANDLLRHGLVTKPEPPNDDRQARVWLELTPAGHDWLYTAAPTENRHDGRDPATGSAT